MAISKVNSKTFYVLGRVLLFYISTVILFATISGFFKGLPYANHASLLLSSVLTFTLVVLFTRWEKLTLSEIGISFQRLGILEFVIGFGIGIVMVAIQAIVTTSFAEVTFVLSPDIPLIRIASSFVLYMLVAVREELVFRSYSMRSLANSIDPIFAIIVITIIFILEHVIAGVSWKMSVIGSGFGGILFGLAALKTKGISLPLGIHASWNFTQWMLGFKDDTGIWKEIVKAGEESRSEDVALTGFVMAMSMAIALILILYRNQRV
jgi:membrane protease YdiL (CAAX protease family)